MSENEHAVKRAAWQSFKFFVALRIASLLWILVFSQTTDRTIIEPNVLCKSQPLAEANQVNGIFLNSALRWDTLCYLQIAEYGYTLQPELTVWPPLYPILIRIFAILFQPPILAALIVSSLATWVAFFLLYLLVEHEHNEELAKNSLFIYTIYPLSFFLVSGYSESTFLCFTLFSIWMARRRSWGWAGIAAAAAVLTRNQGVLLSLVLAYEGIVVHFFQTKEKNWYEFFRFLVACSLPIIAFFGFSAYAHYSLNADWPWQTLGQLWGQYTGLPWVGIIGNIKRLFTVSTSTDLYWLPTTIVDLIMAILIPIVLIWKARSIRSIYIVYAWAMLLLSLMKLGPGNTLVSFSRYALMIFPFFIMLAPFAAKRFIRLLMFALGLMFQGMLIYMFYIWSWAG